MRALFRALAAIGVAGVVACNLIVEAQFKDKKTPGQDGATTVLECDGYQIQATACGNCIQQKCASQLSALCSDNANTIASAVSSCSKNPSIDDGQCRSLFTDAGPVTYDDTAGRAQNLRACFTAQCAKPGACITCEGLTFKKYAADKDNPLTAAAGECAACLLTSCQDALLGIEPGQSGGHCCYPSTVSGVWGGCLLDPDQGQDCSKIAQNASKDGGSKDCSYYLAACAMACKGTCNIP